MKFKISQLCFILLLCIVACNQQTEESSNSNTFNKWIEYKGSTYQINYPEKDWHMKIDSSVGNVPTLTYIDSGTDSIVRMSIMIKELMHPAIIGTTTFDLEQEARKINNNMRFLNGYQQQNVTRKKIAEREGIEINFSITGDDGLPLQIKEYYLADKTTFLLIQSSGEEKYFPVRDSIVNSLKFF